MKVPILASLSSSQIANCLACLLLVAVIGCGEDTGGRVAISGDVTLDGQPLDQGVIEIIAIDGSSQSGAMIRDGSFSIPAMKGLKPGEYQVRIYSSEGGQQVIEAMPGDSSAVEVAKERIPAQYNVDSTLTAKIEPADNHLKFEIP